MAFGRILEVKEKQNKVTIKYENKEVMVEIITPQIIRVNVPEENEEYISKAIEGEKEVPTEFKVTTSKGDVTIETDEIRVVVADEFKVDFYKKDGTPLLLDYTGERKNRKVVPEYIKQILAAEGHDISKIGKDVYDVMTIKCLDSNDKIYGLGDKTGYLNKRNYEYENWNSDVPQAHTDDFHALYKSIPFMMVLKDNGVYGLFFDNTYHGYMNLGKECDEYFYYGADGGSLNYYFLGGNDLKDIIRNYTYLTGTTPLPQRWTLGYQQSRWGYESADEIREIANKMRENKIPCDSIHFDIDYMEDYKVFTWNEKDYEARGKLMGELKEMGIKPVAIIDPGTKAEEGYFMYDEGIENGYFAVNQAGEVYHNAVWPGDSVFPDFGKADVRKWWGDKEKLLLDFGVKGVWNDMNEPASFEGELPPDVVFHEDDRVMLHEEMHNVYGHFMGKATYEGLRKHSKERPFVITRACYAGTQKYSTVWTGDNQSLWSHLQMTIPQLCNLGMSGFAFCGADIGGFGADTTPELLTRWIEAAVFVPLFRNHAAKGSRNQEPWRFDETTLNIYRKYVMLRYKFIPYIYDLFYQGEKTGLPILRPLVLHYENDVNTHNMNGEFLVGENILVAPVVEQGAEVKLVYLPEGIWYDYWTGEKHEGGKYIMKEAKLDVLPMYIKAGSVIPTYEPIQYVGEDIPDKVTLLVAPGEGEYEHFVDDGAYYDYKEGKYTLYRFILHGDQVDTEILHDGYKQYKEVNIEHI